MLAIALLFGAGLWQARAAGPEVNAPGGVAIHGYDPVAYFADGQPTMESPDISAERDGVTYRFATTANRDAFVADPAVYAPEFGGYCAMGTSLGKKIDVDPTPWRIVDGRLYPNSSAGARNAWLSDVTGNITKANRHRPEIEGRTPADVN